MAGKIIDKLIIEFVSLCKAGVNPYSYIKICKGEKSMEDVNVILDEKSLAKAISDAILASNVKDEKDVETITKSLTATIQEQIKPVIETLEKAIKAPEMPDEEIRVGEQVFKKSLLGSDAFEALKKSQEALIEKSLIIEKAEYRTRAEKEYPHVAGTSEEKGEFLREIEKSLSEEGQKFAKSLLTALNVETKQMMIEKSSGTPVEESRAEILKSQAKEFAKAHNCTEEEAFIKLAEMMGDKYFEGE